MQASLSWTCCLPENDVLESATFLEHEEYFLHMIRSSIGKQLFQWVKVNTCIKVINMLTNQVKSEGMRIHLNNQSTRRACKNQSNWQSNMKWKRNKVAGMHPAMKLSLKWSNYPAISKKKWIKCSTHIYCPNPSEFLKNKWTCIRIYSSGHFIIYHEPEYHGETWPRRI